MKKVAVYNVSNFLAYPLIFSNLVFFRNTSINTKNIMGIIRKINDNTEAIFQSWACKYGTRYPVNDLTLPPPIKKTKK